MPLESSRRKRRVTFYRTFALALELPIIITVAPAIGFLLGRWLDARLGSSPLLTLLLGLVGFVAGVREVLRRIPKDETEQGDEESASEAGKPSGDEERKDRGNGRGEE